jgi:hypothetical protein
MAGIAIAGVTAAVASFAASPAQAQEGQIQAANTADSVANSYIVVLKGGVVGEGSTAASQLRANVSAQAQTLAGRYGAHVSRTYGSALPGFSVSADEVQAKRLAADSGVAYVVQDHRVQALDTQSNPPSWGLDRVDQHDLPLDNAYNFRQRPTT